MTTNSTYCMTQSRSVPSIQPAGRKTTRQIFALLRAMMNINPYQRHAPSNHIITIGLDIPTISSVPKPRWNFRKANWPEFTKSIDESINRIPPRSENYQRFCKLIITKAKKYIPRGVRKSYIPCWTNESEALFKKYKESGDPDTGKKLMTSLKEGRCKRWSEELAALDFTHSNRRA